ncbi:MAG: hypothetical protein NUV41_07455 [Eubacteriales bacterium]|jgi:hypothetical protein|nr:hypothetical protein [Eubacteriales bacterium]
MQGKYVWICEIKYSENGDISKLAHKAKELGLAGYIIKTHDGTSVWQQAQMIKNIKTYGLKCGAWGYCYGKNINGEIAAIRESISNGADFYVADVEVEFENRNMRDAAEKLMLGIKDSSVPIGYTSFAIPNYHPLPYDIFSKYSKFAMPQIYWSYMRWPLEKAFNTSIQQYSQYKIPIYPIGQISGDATPQEIQDFNAMCRAARTPVFSYWSYQGSNSVQLAAIRENYYKNLEDAVKLLHEKGIIESPEYWLQNAGPSGTVKGEFAASLIIKMASKL